ncbi:MAG: hypothetical protein WBP54_10015 [Pelodictyon phaeoclathratiforme]
MFLDKFRKGVVNAGKNLCCSLSNNVFQAGHFLITGIDFFMDKINRNSFFEYYPAVSIPILHVVNKVAMMGIAGGECIPCLFKLRVGVIGVIVCIYYGHVGSFVEQNLLFGGERIALRSLPLTYEKFI